MPNFNKTNNALFDAINAERGSEDALIRLYTHLKGADALAQNSVKITLKGGVWYVTEWTNGAAGRGLNFATLLFGYVKNQNLNAADALALQTELYRIGTGAQFVGACVADAPKAARAKISKPKNKVEKKGAGHFVAGSWDAADGKALLDYFAEKCGIAGAGALAFLDKYGIKPLIKCYFQEGGEFTPVANDKETLSYAITAADWIKKKQPFAPKSLKDAYINAGANPYIFGVPQLPNTGENLFIFEGETDALCAAFHGFNAVCIGGAGKDLDECIAKDLAARFTNIYVLFDADKAGTDNAQNFADKHGFINIDTDFCIAYFRTQNAGYIGLSGYSVAADLCGVFNLGKLCELGAAYAVRHFANICIDLNKREKAHQKDALNISVPHFLSAPFNQYISERGGAYNVPQILALALAKFGRVCLQAAAGAGKSSALPTLIKEHLLNENSQTSTANEYSGTYKLGIKKVVLALPTIALAKQLHAAFLQTFPNCALITGEKSATEKRESTGADVVLCVYNSIRFVDCDNDYTALIVDETQLIASERNYRAGALQAVLDAINSCKYTLGISATPNYLFNEYLGFKLLRCTPKNTNSKSVELCRYSGKETDLMPYVIDKIKADFAGKSLEERGTVIIKFDGAAALRAGAAYAKSLGLTSEVFTTKHKDFCTDNANYNSILNKSQLATKVDIIFTTRILEAGVSIKDKISHIYILDTVAYDKIIQQIARARMYLGINANVTATVFFSSEKDAEKYSTSIKKTFYKTLSAAQKKADEYNKISTELYPENDADKDILLAGDPFDYVFEGKDGAYKVDVLWLLYKSANRANTKDFNTLSARLKRYDSTIKNVFFTSIDIYENADFNDCLDTVNTYLDSLQKTAQNIILRAGADDTNLKLLVFALLQLEKDPEDRGIWTNCFGLLGTDGKAAKAFFDSLADADKTILLNEDAELSAFWERAADFKTGDKTRTLLDCLGAAYRNNKVEKKDNEYKIKRTDIKEREKRINAPNAKIGAKELAIYAAQKALRAVLAPKIKDIKRGKNDGFTKLELLEIVNRVITKPPHNFQPKAETGANSVFAFLGQIYKREKVGTAKHEKGEKTRYNLVRIDTAKD